MTPRFPDPARALNAARAGGFTPAYDIVLLDLDGTLTDSAPGIMAALRVAYDQVGLPIPGPAELASFVGPPIHVSLPRHGVPASLVPAVLDAYRTAYSGGLMFESSVYPSMRDALGRMRASGVSRLAVATSKPEVYASRILHRFELAGSLDAVYGASLDDSRCEKADVIAYALEREGVEAGSLPPRDRIVMVGDRVHDVTGAHANGIACVGVTWGYGGRPELAQAGADALVDTPAELVTAVVGR